MNVLITGSPGVGKTTIGLLLQKAGYGFIDVDHTQGLTYWQDKKTGERVTSDGNRDLAWYDAHDFNWDQVALEKLLSERSVPVVFVCGVTSNLTEGSNLFDKVILLETDLAILRVRRVERRNKSGQTDYKKEDIEQGFGEHESLQSEMLKRGAIPVDANQSPEAIVRDIISKLGLIV